MDQHPMIGSPTSGEEKIMLGGTFRGKYRGFAVFLICCAILLAAFAVSAVWMQSGEDGMRGLGSFWGNKQNSPTDEGKAPDATPPSAEPPTNGKTPEPIPDGATPIVEMDLSALSLGRSYIHNETVYHPNVEELLGKALFHASETADGPQVLILHTHTSERYLPSGSAYVEGEIGDAAYSRNAEEGVLSVGEELCRTLNEKGVTAIHCTVTHDDPTLGGSYSRAEQTVRRYLREYPSIRLVIDLHRDAVTTAEGTLVRTVASDGESAQVMAVVGSDGNGTAHPRWQENLALALQLRERLNLRLAGACRPVSLRNASFHQELAPYSLLLEVGTVANSPEEARAAARRVGECLAEMLQSSIA